MDSQSQGVDFEHVYRVAIDVIKVIEYCNAHLWREDAQSKALPRCNPHSTYLLLWCKGSPPTRFQEHCKLGSPCWHIFGLVGSNYNQSLRPLYLAFACPPVRCSQASSHNALCPRIEDNKEQKATELQVGRWFRYLNPDHHTINVSIEYLCISVKSKFNVFAIIWNNTLLHKPCYIYFCQRWKIQSKWKMCHIF